MLGSDRCLYWPDGAHRWGYMGCVCGRSSNPRAHGPYCPLPQDHSVYIHEIYPDTHPPSGGDAL